MSIKATISAPASFVATAIAPGSYKGIATTPAPLVAEIKGIHITNVTGGTTATADALVLTADGGDTFDPPSGQTIIYLPSATARYHLHTLSGILFPGIHYTRTSNQITLLTGDISADDKFLLCEY